MRRVLFKWHNEKSFTRKGFFHGWGLEIYESDGSACSQTVAIIEIEGGAIVTTYATDVKFLALPAYEKPL